MKIAVQAKLYTKTVQPAHVRDLYGTQHEGATLGIMIITSGYGPASVEFASGKPLHLIDGPGLIAICQEHGIPARVLGIGDPGGLFGFYAVRLSSRRARWLVRRRSSGVPVQ